MTPRRRRRLVALNFDDRRVLRWRHDDGARSLDSQLLLLLLGSLLRRRHDDGARSLHSLIEKRLLLELLLPELLPLTLPLLLVALAMGLGPPLLSLQLPLKAALDDLGIRLRR